MLIEDHAALRERWVEQSNNLLDRPSSISTTALDQIPQQPTLEELDLTPTVEELKKAINKILTEHQGKMEYQLNYTKLKVQKDSFQ
jgi:hypothetical protein